MARVSPLPYTVPVVEHGDEHPTYISVAVDPVHKASSAESPGYGGPQRTADGVGAILRYSLR